jgi:hypothetical protein
MANVYKTAKGKMIDIDKIKLSNENAIAVGNMKVNARGDLLGAGAQVVAGRNQVMDRVYAVEDSGYSPMDPAAVAARQAVMEASNAQQLSDLTNNLIVAPTTENTTATDTVPAARGSLASSVAKPTTVTQEAMPTPSQQKKSNGPSRI